MITNLIDFQLSKVLESLVQLDGQVIEMLHKIDHPISDEIISMIDDNNFIDTESDLKDISVVYLSQKPDEINYKRKNRELNSADIMKVGKFLKKINNKYNPTDIEKFVTIYKSIYLEKEADPVIIYGEDIRKAFLIKNVAAEVGDYATNCMRYESTQEFLDIYVKNPDSVSAVILTNEDNKILSRALLWKTNEGDIVMDRVYAVDPGWKRVLHNWANEQGYYYRAKDDTKPFNIDIFIHRGKEVIKNFTVTLKEYTFKTYPYLDTFFYLDTDGMLYNFAPQNKSYYELRNSNGLLSSLIEYEWWMDQKAQTKEQVIEFLDKSSIFEYKINDDLSVDVFQKVNIIWENIKTIPVTFKSIKGNVILSGNKLQSLKGLPREIHGTLDVSNNQLKSLEGCPEIIHEDFDASDCFLKTLEFGPKQVMGDYIVERNELINIDDIAQEIGGDYIAKEQKSNKKFNKTYISSLSTISGNIII
jgi:hypothetical protein